LHWDLKIDSEIEKLEYLILGGLSATGSLNGVPLIRQANLSNIQSVSKGPAHPSG